MCDVHVSLIVVAGKTGVGNGSVEICDRKQSDRVPHRLPERHRHIVQHFIAILFLIRREHFQIMVELHLVWNYKSLVGLPQTVEYQCSAVSPAVEGVRVLADLVSHQPGELCWTSSAFEAVEVTKYEKEREKCDKSHPFFASKYGNVFNKMLFCDKMGQESLSARTIEVFGTSLLFLKSRFVITAVRPESEHTGQSSGVIQDAEVVLDLSPSGQGNVDPSLHCLAQRASVVTFQTDMDSTPVGL